MAGARPSPNAMQARCCHRACHHPKCTAELLCENRGRYLQFTSHEQFNKPTAVLFHINLRRERRVPDISEPCNERSLAGLTRANLRPIAENIPLMQTKLIRHCHAKHKFQMRPSP